MALSSTTKGSDTHHELIPDSAKDTEESILGRKRKLKGLPSSFSSNLGRRISPPYPRNASGSTKTAGRSVKSIVAWLESSPNNTNTSRHSGDEAKPELSIGAISSVGSTSSLRSQRTLHGAADVEEYSLTLLKYKKYFTELPLGRCLDEQHSFSASACELVDPEAKDDLLRGVGERNTTSGAYAAANRLEGNATRSQGKQNNAELRSAGNTAAKDTDSSGMNGFPLVHRDPGEVQAF